MKPTEEAPKELGLTAEECFAWLVARQGRMAILPPDSPGLSCIIMVACLGKGQAYQFSFGVSNDTVNLHGGAGTHPWHESVSRAIEELEKAIESDSRVNGSRQAPSGPTGIVGGE